jgi:hypothetical protein
MLVVVRDIPLNVLDEHLAEMKFIADRLLAWAHVPGDAAFVTPPHLPVEFQSRWRNQARMRSLTVQRHVTGFDVRRARASVQALYSAVKGLQQ